MNNPWVFNFQSYHRYCVPCADSVGNNPIETDDECEEVCDITLLFKWQISFLIGKRFDHLGCESVRKTLLLIAAH